MSDFLRMTAAQIKEVRGLGARPERRRQGRYLAEGDHLTGEAIHERAALSVLVMEGMEGRFGDLLRCGLPVYLLSERAFLQTSDTRTPQGIAALCRLPQSVAPVQLGERIVALNALQDPGNVGAIIRSMDAAGFTGLMIDAECADPYGPKALRASMGSAFRMPVCQIQNLPEGLRSLNDYELIAGSLDGEPFFNRKRTQKKVCFLIGNEGAGLSRDILEMATMRLKLPMRGGAESLNAAAAATVMMYDFLRVWEEEA